MLRFCVLVTCIQYPDLGHPHETGLIAWASSGRARDGRLSRGARRQGRGADSAPVSAVLDRAFLRELPRLVRAIAVMDRTKEPGALGEPLYQDVVTALAEARADGTSSLAAEPIVVGGRYGLSSKEFTPAMVKAIFDALADARPKNHFPAPKNRTRQAR